MTTSNTSTNVDDAVLLANNATSINDTLLQSVSWICNHYETHRSTDALLAGLPYAGMLTPSLALSALSNAGMTGGVVKRNVRSLPAQVMPMVLLRKEQGGCILLARTEVRDEENKRHLRYSVILPEVSNEAVELSQEEMDAMYAGYAILVKPRAQVDNRAGETLPTPDGHWLLSTLWRYRRYYRSAAIASVVANVLALASIFFTMNVYDRVVPNQAFVTLWSLGIGVIVAMLFEAMIRFVRAHLLDVAGKKADLVLGAMLFRQALSVRMEHKPASSGSFANQLREFESVRDFASSATLAAISDLPFVLLFVGVIFFIGGPLGWVPLLILPLILIISICIQWPLARVMQENLRESSLKQGVLVESVEGLETLKATGGYAYMQRRWEHFSALQSATSMKSRKLSSAATGVVTLLQQLQTVALVITGVYLITDGTLTMGALIGTVMLAGRATAPLGQVIGLAVRFQQAKAALTSLNKLMELPVDRDANCDYLPSPVLTGQLTLKAVGFSYPAPPMQPNPPVLTAINMTIKPGERIAILGRIGSGKRIALPAGHALRELLQPAWAYRFVDSESMTASLQMVASGQADATMALLPIAQYYTTSQHEGALKVAGIVQDMPTGLSFATRKGDTELASILEKALLQIPPDEIDIFQNRWRPKPELARTAWVDYRSLIYKVGGAAFLLILLSLVWNLHIRKQYKRRQQAENALSEQLSFTESLINGTPHPMYVRDCDGRLVTCNSNYLEVFGATREAVVGKTSLEGVKLDVEEARQFHNDYLWVVENGMPLEMDRTLHLPGRILSVYHWIHPYSDSQGQLKGVICGWIDVSDRRELMEDLRTALDAADQSSRAKTTFLATMSHEIRTPMSAVIGMLELAMMHAEQGRFDKPAIEVAYDSARGLLELIGDILDVVRIESGHASLCPRRGNLREVVESVVRVFDGLARQKAITLTLQMDAIVNRDVLVDPMRLKQVLSNLVGNAIKFTDSGEVKIIIDGKPLADERLLVSVRVEDTGIGIAEDELAGLFEPFAQANHGHTSRGGTGLGLPICKSLCELMGGHITARSVKGKGTRMTLEIPFNVLPALEVAAVVQEEVQGTEHPVMRILVIDDQQANRVLLTQQLTLFGQVVFSAENGEEGLRVWQEQPVDVIITDCNMPVMNGYEMARAIRKEEEQNGMAPCAIIGFTANAQPEEKAKCVQAGMDDCLFKPVSLATVSQLLMSLAGMPQVVRPLPSEVTESTITSILRELTGGDPAMGAMLLEEAHQSYIDDLTELGAQRQQLDPATLARLAHRIKGGARILQAQDIVAGCAQLERLCEAQHPDSEAILTLMQQVERDLERLIDEVAAFRASERAVA